MAKIAILSLHTSPLDQPGTGDGGGLNVYVRELAAALARSGTPCDVFTRADSLQSLGTREIEPGLRVRGIAVGPLRPIDKAELYDLVPAMAERLAAEIDSDNATGVDAVTAIHANYWLSAMVGHLLKHRTGIPLVTTFHTLDRVKSHWSKEDIDPIDPERRSRQEEAVIGCSDAIIASCSVEADELIQLYGADPERVVIVPPGVDKAFFSPGNRQQARKAIAAHLSIPMIAGPLLLFVGRIQPLKGTEIAVGALAALDGLGVQDATLIVVGGPSGKLGLTQYQQLQEMVADAGLHDQVRFVAPQAHELLSTFYRAADCCLVPSRSESFGLVALEAAACGTPVVASAVGGLTTLVDHGVTGFLVQEPRADAFAEHACHIVTDRELASQMGQAATARAQSYSWAAAATELRCVYDKLSETEPVTCG